MILKDISSDSGEEVQYEIVEDDRAIIAALEQYLRTEDFDPVSATGEREAVRLMDAFSPELVLIDMADISRGNALFDVGGMFLTMYMSGMKDPSITYQTIGIEYELAKQVWGIALSTYYGTSDRQKLELLGQRCGAFALLRMATTLGMGTKRSKAHASSMVPMLRERLFPNTDNFCRLFAMPV